MNNTKNKTGYPVDGEANAKLAYLASKISSTALSDSAGPKCNEFKVRLEANHEGRLYAAGFSLRVD
jgi:hypothetical protein